MIFFDFDGVFFDSVKEAYAVAKIAMNQELEIQDINFDSNEYKIFRKNRYLIGPAWNYFYMFKNINDNVSGDNFEEVFIERIKVANKTEYEEFERAYFNTRNVLKEKNYDEWLALNESFSFLEEMKNFLKKNNSLIITTKDKATVHKLLWEKEIKFPMDKIYDKDNFAIHGSKSNIIENIMRELNIKEAIFIDDSKKHLMTCESIEGLKCYQPNWGYISPNDENTLTEEEMKNLIINFNKF